MTQVHVAGRLVPGAAEFFDRLEHSSLPLAVREPIKGGLSILLEDDGDKSLVPELDSFDAFLRFLVEHRDLPVPAIAVSPSRKIVAGWQDAALRFTLEFLSAGYVRWLRVERGDQVDGGLVFSDNVRFPAALPNMLS